MRPQRTLLLSSLAVAAACASSHARAHGSDPGQRVDRPNIVLIIADDCRMLDLGCYGSPDAKTPNIDRLAGEGLKFNSFFQAASMSSPTRQCLLSGLYPVRSGAYPNHTFIREWVVTLPAYLKQAGYRVAAQGKRHYAPLERYPFEYLGGKGTEGDIDIAKVEPFLAEVAGTRDPFFLYLASTEPHTPWTKGDRSQYDAHTLRLPPTLVDTRQTRQQYVNYLAEVTYLDGHIGRIDALLEKYGLSDNTIFIFTSEQGHSFPFAKWTCYDAGVQTGFIVRWKGVIEPGRQTDAICEYVDVTPTLVDIATGKVPDGVDGRSFLPVLKAERDTFKEYTFCLQTSRGIVSGPEYYGIRSVRDSRYRYIRNLTPGATFRCAATTDAVWRSWQQQAGSDGFAASRVKAYQTRPGEELYDVVEDPYQMNNLAGERKYRNVIKRMGRELDRWMAGQGDEGQPTEMEALERQWKK